METNKIDNLEEDTEDININSLFQPHFVQCSSRIGGIEIQFVQSQASSTDYDQTGQVLWRVSNIFVQFLLNFPRIVEKRNILELGSGTTGFGCVSSLLLGANKGVCSDGQEELTILCERTLELNGLREKGSSVHLRWGDSEQLMKVINEHLIDEKGQGKVDVVIGCDVCVWEEFIHPLFQTAVEAISFGKQQKELEQERIGSSKKQAPLIIFAFERRALRPEKKMDEISKQFKLERIRFTKKDIFISSEIPPTFLNTEFFIDVYFT
ncbi:MAG: hypothetical protein EZS28_041133 [Streblomastix strix]|uniref:Uncharacterized protein n=1 Tax=Streblomastix strix TaxID=222440 RepID=A0A5J4TZ85_9EUKA|nr:MAG: hypothetical protein EZS28_041133 [Streblomastix strix]